MTATSSVPFPSTEDPFEASLGEDSPPAPATYHTSSSAAKLAAAVAARTTPNLNGQEAVKKTLKDHLQQLGTKAQETEEPETTTKLTQKHRVSPPTGTLTHTAAGHAREPRPPKNSIVTQIETTSGARTSRTRDDDEKRSELDEAADADGDTVWQASPGKTSSVKSKSRKPSDEKVAKVEAVSVERLLRSNQRGLRGKQMDDLQREVLVSDADSEADGDEAPETFSSSSSMEGEGEGSEGEAREEEEQEVNVTGRRMQDDEPNG